MPLTFLERALALQQSKQSDLALVLAPRITRLPLPIQRYDDPFLPFGKAVLQEARPLLCAVIYDFSAYLALGAAGIVALERTIAYAGGDVLNIIHGPFVGPHYASLLDEGSFNADAVTLASAQDVGAYALRPDRAAFVCGSLALLPGAGQVFDPSSMRLRIGLPDTGCTLRCVDESVLYLDRGDGFAQTTCAALERLR